jgi:hypothetical protein
MNSVFVIVIIIALFLLLCSRQEDYYNVFGQYIEAPFDDTDGAFSVLPSYSLSRFYPYSVYYDNVTDPYYSVDGRYWL